VVAIKKIMSRKAISEVEAVGISELPFLFREIIIIPS